MTRVATVAQISLAAVGVIGLVLAMAQQSSPESVSPAFVPSTAAIREGGASRPSVPRGRGRDFTHPVPERSEGTEIAPPRESEQREAERRQAATWIDELRSRESGVASAARGHLARAGQQAIPAIVDFVADDDPGRRRLGLLAWELVSPAGEAHLDLLQLQLRDATGRDIAVRVLEDFGERASPAAAELASLLGTGANTGSLASTLAAIGPDAIAPVIVRAQAYEVEVRRAAFVALSRIDGGTDSRDITAALERGLLDDDRSARSICIHALRVTRPRSPAVRAALQTALLSTDEYVRRIAREALDKEPHEPDDGGD